MELVSRSDDSGIAILSLNRPDMLNALSPSLFNELRAHIDAIAEQTEAVGCVILRGEGRSFSAGNDLKAIQSGEKPPSAHFQAETLDAIERLPQPVIAAVQGHCYTGALELAIACDLLIAADNARFCDTHGKWGMSPTWGMSQRLPRRVGLLAAKEMMFSGRVIGGEEAVAMAEVGSALERFALVATPEEAADPLRSWLSPGDVVLLKASRGVALERLLPALETLAL